MGLNLAHAYSPRYAFNNPVGTGKGLNTEYVYDPFYRLIEVKTHPDNTTTSQTYTFNLDDMGNVTYLTGPNNYGVGNSYDSCYRLILTRIYDTSDASVPGLKEQYSYDNCGRITEYTDSDGYLWLFEYYQDGSLFKQTDPTGRQYWYAYNDTGQLVRTADPDKNISSIYYGSTGLIDQFPDAGKTYSDLRGFLSATVSPEGRTTAYLYDDYNRLK